MTMVEAHQAAALLDLRAAENRKPVKVALPQIQNDPVVIDTNYDYLRPFLPGLKPLDLKGMSDADLKRLYYQAYRAQGITVKETLQTADRLVVMELSSEDDPYSLAPGQIASSTKVSVGKKRNSTSQTPKQQQKSATPRMGRSSGDFPHELTQIYINSQMHDFVMQARIGL
jgi:hypothetical protein